MQEDYLSLDIDTAKRMRIKDPANETEILS